MNTTENLINLNSASSEELRQLSGIGQVLAERIQKGRPYKAIEDLLKVNGVSDALLTKWRPYLTLTVDVEPSIEEEPSDDETLIEIERTDVSEISEDVFLEDVSQDVADAEIAFGDDLSGDHDLDLDEKIEESKSGTSDDIEGESKEMTRKTEIGVEEKIPPAKNKSISKTPSKGVSPWQLTWVAVFCIIFGSVISVAATLGILAAINQGQLRYATPAQVRTTQLQVENVETSLGSLEEDLAGLRLRVDNLDLVTNRVTDVENTIGEINQNIDSISSSLDQIHSQLQELSLSLDAISKQNTRYETFFQGLNDLMNSLFQLEGTNE